MTPPLITALVAAILGLWFILLSLNVVRMRVKSGISIYYGDNKELAVAIRRHGNLAENVGLALILLALLEMLGGPDMAVYILGAILILVRIIHPFGLNFDSPNRVARAIGGIGTTSILLVTSIWLIVIYIGA